MPVPAPVTIAIFCVGFIVLTQSGWFSPIAH